MAKNQPQAAAQVKARVIFPGMFGELDDVVMLDKDVAELAKSMGDIDTHPDAVAFAENLKAA